MLLATQGTDIAVYLVGAFFLVKALITIGVIRINDNVTKATDDATKNVAGRAAVASADVVELQSALSHIRREVEDIGRRLDRLAANIEDCAVSIEECTAIQREQLSVVKQFPGLVSVSVARQPSLEDLTNITRRLDHLIELVTRVKRSD